MTNKTCPVCGLEQEPTAAACDRCGWDFSPLLGTPEQARAVLDQRLEQARGAWQQRGFYFLPDDEKMAEPRLQRGPFETQEEFAQRIGSRPWCVGTCFLIPNEYNTETGRFRLRSLNWDSRTKHLMGNNDYYYIDLARDDAKTMYDQSNQWSVFAWFCVKNGKIKLIRQVLCTRSGELRLSRSLRGSLWFVFSVLIASGFAFISFMVWLVASQLGEWTVWFSLLLFGLLLWRGKRWIDD